METEKLLLKRNQQIEFYRKQINDKFRKKEVKDIRLFLQKNMDIIKHDNDLMVVWYLGIVVEREMKLGQKNIFEKVNSLEELLERYRRLKFYVRRIEYDVFDNIGEFFSFLSEQSVSEFELMGIVDSCVYDKEEVWKKIFHN